VTLFIFNAEQYLIILLLYGLLGVKYV